MSTMAVGMNVGSFLLKSARQRPNRVAITFEGEDMSYAQLAERSLRVADVYERLGLRRGDRVAIVQRNGPAYFESLYGAFLAGMVAVPINRRLSRREITFIVENSGAGVIVHGGEFNDSLRGIENEVSTVQARLSLEGAEGELDYEREMDHATPREGAAEVDSEQPAWLFYTSGTTGKPKGAVWTHRIVRVLTMNYLADVYNMQPEDVVLHAAPLSHGSGVVGLPAVAKGAQNVILGGQSFRPESLFEAVEDYAVTNIAFLAPTQIVMMLRDWEERFDLSSLRNICYGGAPMYMEDLKEGLDKLGPVFVQVYGQGEAPLTITYLRREDHWKYREVQEDRLGSAGVARTDVEVRIGEPGGRSGVEDEHLSGEILVRGDVVMAGYWEDEAASREAFADGWLRTGDVGVFDENGYLYILDRAKDMIVSGGTNIYPREVEEVLLQIPGVVEACVIGVPDEYWGEAVHALVVAEDGLEVSLDVIRDYCGEDLAGYKKPKSLEVVEELPKSAYGKVLKRELREEYWEGYERRVGGGRKK